MHEYFIQKLSFIKKIVELIYKSILQT